MNLYARNDDLHAAILRSSIIKSEMLPFNKTGK